MNSVSMGRKAAIATWINWLRVFQSFWEVKIGGVCTSRKKILPVELERRPKYKLNEETMSESGAHWGKGRLYKPTWRQQRDQEGIWYRWECNRAPRGTRR